MVGNRSEIPNSSKFGIKKTAPSDRDGGCEDKNNITMVYKTSHFLYNITANDNLIIMKY